MGEGGVRYKVPRYPLPFGVFYDLDFRQLAPKFFKAPLTPICTNFEGDRAKKHPFLTCPFKKMSAAQKFQSKKGLDNDLRELGKTIWSTYKKIGKFFENHNPLSPPIEKILNPP